MKKNSMHLHQLKLMIDEEKQFLEENKTLEIFFLFAKKACEDVLNFLDVFQNVINLLIDSNDVTISPEIIKKIYEISKNISKSPFKYDETIKKLKEDIIKEHRRIPRNDRFRLVYEYCLQFLVILNDWCRFNNTIDYIIASLEQIDALLFVASSVETEKERGSLQLQQRDSENANSLLNKTNLELHSRALNYDKSLFIDAFTVFYLFLMIFCRDNNVKMSVEVPKNMICLTFSDVLICVSSKLSPIILLRNCIEDIVNGRKMLEIHIQRNINYVRAVKKKKDPCEHVYFPEIASFEASFNKIQESLSKLRSDENFCYMMIFSVAQKQYYRQLSEFEAYKGTFANCKVISKVYQAAIYWREVIWDSDKIDLSKTFTLELHQKIKTLMIEADAFRTFSPNYNATLNSSISDMEAISTFLDNDITFFRDWAAIFKEFVDLVHGNLECIQDQIDEIRLKFDLAKVEELACELLGRPRSIYFSYGYDRLRWISGVLQCAYRFVDDNYTGLELTDKDISERLELLREEIFHVRRYLALLSVYSDFLEIKFEFANIDFKDDVESSKLSKKDMLIEDLELLYNDNLAVYKEVLQAIPFPKSHILGRNMEIYLKAFKDMLLKIHNYLIIISSKTKTVPKKDS